MNLSKLKILYCPYAQVQLDGYYSKAAWQELLQSGTITTHYPPSQTWLYLKALRRQFKYVETFLLDQSYLVPLKDQDADPFLKTRYNRFDKDAQFASLEKAMQNRALLNKVAAFKPDIIWVYMGMNIYPETWQEIKAIQPNISIICQSGVNPIEQEMDLIVRSFPYYDLYLTNDFNLTPYYEKGLQNGLSIDLACDPDYHKPVALSREETARFGKDEVCFHGSCDTERPTFFKQLAEENMGIWGQDWPERCEEYPEVLEKYRGPLWTKDMAKLYSAAKGAINRHIQYSSGVNVRTFETAACGITQLCDTKYRDHVAELFEPEKEILFYENAEELKELIRRVRDYPEETEKIKEAAMRRAHQKHTYDKRLNQIKEHLAI